MAIDKKLIFWKKQSTFNAPSSITDTTGSVMWYSIVFFKDTGQIWTNGTYYNCGTWGTPQTNYVPLTIGGTSYNLSRDGHTHNKLFTTPSGVSDANALIGNTGEVTYYYNVNTGITNLFPSTNNANSILTINNHSGGYNYQLGFSSNGNMYQRSALPTNFGAWRTILDSVNTFWGTASGDSQPLTINGTTKTLSLSSHTHAYLPLSGGTITSTAERILSLNTSTSQARFFLQESGVDVTQLGHRTTLGSYFYNQSTITGLLLGDDKKIYFTTNGSMTTKYLLWHEGNSNISTVDWAVKDLKASNKIFLTATSGARDILIGNQDSVGVNNPAIIRGVNGAIYLGGGTNWTDGGTFTANMIIQDNGDVSVTNTISANSFVKSGSSNSYILLGGGGQKLITDFDQYEANLKWGGRDFSGSYGCIDAAMVPFLGANRLAFANAAGITIEYSRDSGMTWIDYGASDAQKLNLTSGAGGAGLNIGKCDSTNKDDGTYQLRITFNTSSCGIYTQLNKFCIYLSTDGSVGVTCTIEGALQASPDSYAIFKNSIPVSGWSGYNIINTSSFTTYGNTPASQYGRLRFTFKSTGGSTTYNGLKVQNIFGYGGVGWVTPSNMARWGQIYSYNSSQEVTFPAKVTATSFSGNATSASTLASSQNFSIGGSTGLSAATIGFTGAAGVALQLAGTLNLANGGTGSTTAAGARTNLGAAALAGSSTQDFSTQNLTSANIVAHSFGTQGAIARRALFLTDVRGQLLAGESLADIRGYNYSNDTMSFALRVGGSGATNWERLVVRMDGNVGINTSSPAHKLDVNGNVNATRFFSTQTTGTSPFTVSSTTVVSNLNADLLDGLHAKSNSNGNEAWGYIPIVEIDGVMQVGRYLDFNHSSGIGVDYNARLHTNGVTDGELYINSNRIWHAGNLNLSTYFTYRGSFTSSSNANDMTDMGMWLNTTGNGSGNSNFPAQYGYIQTFSRGIENYSRWQMSVDNTADNIHIRAEWAGTWGGWKKLWHGGNLTNVSQLTNDAGYITSSGSITGNAGTVTITADPTSNAERYILFANSTSGANSIKAASGFRFNPYSGKITSSGIILTSSANDSILSAGGCMISGNYYLDNNKSYFAKLTDGNYYTLIKYGNDNVCYISQNGSDVALRSNNSTTITTNSSTFTIGSALVTSSVNIQASQFNGNLNGDIVKTNPQLAAGLENNEITVVNNANSAITTNSPGSITAIRNAVNFRWYNTNWQIGNIRDGSTGTAGFGITYGASALYFRVTSSATYVYGNLSVSGSGTFTGGGFNSLRELKNIHEDWKGSAIETINQFKVRDFNYKNQSNINRTLGFIIDEIPSGISEYILMGEKKDSVNLYSLHALSFKAHQETKSEIDLLKLRIQELETKIKILENGVK